jgi:hypothetical protein
MEPDFSKPEILKPVAQLMWVTYGRSGKERLHWVRLIDLETDHLKKILLTQPQVRGTDYEVAIKFILQDRKALSPFNDDVWGKEDNDQTGAASSSSGQEINQDP